MNGFEFSQRVKDHAQHRHLPIIAVTSLASDEDRQRGLDAGVDEYQIKIDRDSLIAAVWRLINPHSAMVEHTLQA